MNKENIVEPAAFQQEQWNLPEKHIINLQANRIIGSGSFGNHFLPHLIFTGCVGYVFEAFDTENQRKVAIKRTTKAGEFISREFEVLERLRNCENCV